MRSGKLPPELLKKLLRKVLLGPEVVVGPAFGEDAAAVDFAGRMLVAASDPVTFACDRIGLYAVSINANDLAVHGAVPKWFLATVLLPEESTESQAEMVFDQIESACRSMDISLVGGHTEVTPAVDRVVVCGTMLGCADRMYLVRTGGAHPGDTVLLAGMIAVEGTAILARDAADVLAARGVSEQAITEAAALLDNPGICISPFALAAAGTGVVTGMHDPTEGGLATALRELAEAAECGLEIRREAVDSAVLSQCAEICSFLGLDPLGLIASGSLLITCTSGSEAEVIRAVEAAGAPCRAIGNVTAPENGIRWDDGGELPAFDRDELARYFESTKQDREHR